MKKHVISLGGSILYNKIDSLNFSFLDEFVNLLYSLDGQFFIVVGGGILARELQKVAKNVTQENEYLDLLGITATKINADIVAKRLGCETKSFEEIDEKDKFVVTYGTKPGASTDLVAVNIALKFGIDEVINVTNVDHVYSNFEKKIPVYDITWNEYFDIFKVDLNNLKWSAGGHYPFDLIASLKCYENQMNVKILNNDIEKLKNLLVNNELIGTLIR
ncbi:MAG: hypothetical protein PHT94_01105 [Candidatus Nanoarchaeia archaeon]|nr:hypothetical protein [Candidatus Nanoarchaeia archaeon]